MPIPVTSDVSLEQFRGEGGREGGGGSDGGQKHSTSVKQEGPPKTESFFFSLLCSTKTLLIQFI